MSDQDKINALRAMLELILDQVDYTNNACAPTEMVGAVLPINVITDAHKALRETA